MMNKHAAKSNRPDCQRIGKAIAETPDCSPEGRELAAQLVDAWVREFWEHDAQEQTLGVELKGAFKIAPLTYVLFVIDRLSRAKDGTVYISEWKTVKAPNGRWWTEAKWLDQITSSIQLPTYILAADRGVAWNGKKAVPILPAKGRRSNLYLRVRAVTKVLPPGFWPTAGTGLYEFTPPELSATVSAYMNAAHQIRALKKAGRYPWAYTGGKCFYQYGKDCLFLPVCQRREYPTGNYRQYADMESNHSAWVSKVIPATDLHNPETVVLSATGYETWDTCPEKYRQQKLLGLGKEESTALDIGRAFHAGLKEMYAQI